jgi:ABC-2 type transport system ATP-binding protein
VAEKLCDRLLIMKKGHILVDGSLAALREHFGSGVQVDIRLLNEVSAETLTVLSAQPQVLRVDSLDLHTLRVTVSVETVVPHLIQILVADGALLASVIPIEKTIEEVYLNLQEEVLP